MADFIPADNFVDDSLISRDVKLADGQMHVIWFKPMGYVEWNSVLADQSISVAERYARLISSSVRDADGKIALKVDRVRNLKVPIFQALRDAMLNVNGYGEQAEAEAGKG